jgi:histidinol phosphatase-like PHP family hydrolase
MQPWTNFHCHTYVDSCCPAELTPAYYAGALGETMRRAVITNHGFIHYFEKVPGIPWEVLWQGQFMEDPQWFDRARETGNARLQTEMQTIRALNNPNIFFGIETDMMCDGRLTHDPHFTELFDVILCGTHFMPWIEKIEGNKAREKAWLDYMDRLLDKPEIDVLSHPFRRIADLTGRLVSDETVDSLLRWVAARGVTLELNSNANTPETAEVRMLRFAAEHGIPLVVGTDSHNFEQTTNFTIAEERIKLAGLTPADLNIQEVEAFLARKGKRHTAASRPRAGRAGEKVVGVRC